MHPSQIAKAYDQITHLWTDAEFDLGNGIQQHQKAIAHARNRGLALDIGCGCTGRFIDLMLDSGFQPSGIDVSLKMIGLARERHPQVEFHCQDICEYQLPNKYDLISAWDSIWHIPLDQQKAVLGKIVAALNPGGIFIFSFGGLIEAGEHKDSFMGPEVYYSSLGTNGFLQLFLEADCSIKHLEFDQPTEQHAYLIIEKT